MLGIFHILATMQRMPQWFRPTLAALIPTMIVTILVMALRRWPLRFRDRRGFPITPINS